MFDATADPLFVCPIGDDGSLGGLVEVNQAACRSLGFSRESLIGRLPAQLGLFEPLAAQPARRAALLRAGRAVFESALRRADGTEIPVELCAQVFECAQRRLLAALAHDVSERKRTEARLNSIIRNDINGILVVLENGIIQFANPAAEGLFGRSADALVGEPFGLPLTVGESTEIDLMHPVSGKVPVEMRIIPFTWAEQPAYLVSLHDLSERLRFEQALRYQSTHDALTRLPNRNLLRELIDQAILAAVSQERGLAVLLLDLDRFKLTNDTLGRDAGDAILREVARRLVDAMPGELGVARCGDDEFVVLGVGLAHGEDATALAVRLLELLAPPFALDGRELHVGASLGISVYPKDGRSADALLKCAEIAMYRAKEQGGERFCYFAEEMNARALRRLELETDLRAALVRGEFALHYQPKVEMQSGRIAGAEALIRWHHPDKGVIPPDEFIPLAEETGLILPIGRWILRTGCAQIRALQDACGLAVPISLNVSAYQFTHDDILSAVREAIVAAGLEPRLLELELTESTVMHDAEYAVGMLQALKQLGVRLALDDFGTGYSSLQYLRRFPIDVLKIDRSFVVDVTSRTDAAAIATTVIAMARRLKLHVIAEGVETAGQFHFLRRHGCNDMQGYYFSRPLPLADFQALLAGGRGLDLSGLALEEAQRTLLLVAAASARRDALGSMLAHDGYRILTAADGHEALECLACHPVQVAISDQGMPDMSGTEFLGRIRDLHPDTVRILLSDAAEATLDSVIGAINGGAVFKFLLAPWGEDLLREHVREAFRHHCTAPS